MGNRIFIDECSKDNFQGFHAYDDYESCCAFNFENGTPDDDLDFLKDILTCEYGYPEALGELLQFADECEKGITIRDTFYDHEEWYPVWKEHKQ